MGKQRRYWYFGGHFCLTRRGQSHAIACQLQLNDFFAFLARHPGVCICEEYVGISNVESRLSNSGHGDSLGFIFNPLPWMTAACSDLG